MKEFEKVKWLEDLADKYEVPVEQVMLAWSFYQAGIYLGVIRYLHDDEDVVFEEVLVDVFKD